ncbi:MAG TPA: hypothetical protein DDY59_15045 [Lachnospiraceae bacterium]|jgi:AAA15 family ATPase/GTPase|uniref:AAA ATPase-like protein n=1 Tax=Muricomes intestini TaxID=1796634 RepID=A0A4R3KGZ7_9FIRM|nr:AAA family ATPase [Muricomes intestini]TCS82299.1 AAA ATPase-like protein [Muricomes intestini]HAX53745.1 hypothetical protein [Lachnospiraceae bacterium]HBI74476.1 hypothetical protein [Lachnospiraceae bacterium]HCR84688.1 hypothetical protein [Lachnospiraceae bacterium]
MIKSISILGYRGYSTQKTIYFSIPNSNPGSGITFIVGANNSGKTTILESIKAFSSNSAPIFSVLPHDFEWTIDQSDSGQYSIKFIYNGLFHNGEGIGDGIWSLFTICDALYDSTPGSTIIIDEPELSLHPAYQRKLMKLFEEYSKDHQIVINTHSPYFINSNCIANGAALLRTTKLSSNEIQVYNLSDENKKHIKCLVKDLNNLHVLGFFIAYVILTY